MNTGILLAACTYILALLLIARLSYKRSKSSSDFAMGGRSLNFYVTALSAHASDMSSWLFLAYPAAIYTLGGSQAWIAVGLVLGMWANWQFVAPRLRRETERTGSLTLSGYFAARFNDRSGLLGTLGALLSLFFFTVYISSGLVGVGTIFDSVLGINSVVGMTIGIVVVLLYTLVGGYTSVCWVDLFQALFLMAAICIVPIVALISLGSFEPITAAAHVKQIPLSLMPGDALTSLPLILATLFGWGLGYFGQTHILSKFMGIKRPEELKKSKYVGLSWQIVCLAAATLIGLVGIAFDTEGLKNSELLFPLIVKDLFHPFAAGLILCAILAATISTMDSQILVLAPILSEDLYHRLFRKRASEQEILIACRCSVALVGLSAYLIAITSGKSVIELVQYAWSGLGAAFGPLLLMALYSKKANRGGAIAGMCTGGLVAALWGSLPIPYHIPPLIPGFFLNLAVIYAVSIRSSQQSQEVASQ